MRKKIAFVSYSVNAKDEPVIVLLGSKLQSKKMIITSSSLFYSNGSIDFITQRRIRESDLFLGVITRDGQQNNSVLEEYKFAVNNGIPNLLLLEETTSVSLPSKSNTDTILSFNRHKPQPAIDYINKHLLPITGHEDSLPWMLGGAALIAAIGLLSNRP